MKETGLKYVADRLQRKEKRISEGVGLGNQVAFKKELIRVVPY